MGKILYRYTGTTGCMDTLGVDFTSGPNQLWLVSHDFVSPELDNNIVAIEDESYFVCSIITPTPTATIAPTPTPTATIAPTPTPTATIAPTPTPTSTQPNDDLSYLIIPNDDLTYEIL